MGVALALALAPDYAEAGSPDDEQSYIIKNLQKKYESMTTLTADFLQEAYSVSLDSSEFAKGTVAFKKPGMMRWNYYGGGNIVSNGKFIWVYQPELAQVIETGVDPDKAEVSPPTS